MALANRFRAGLGLEPSNSAIVSVDQPDGLERLRAAGMQAAQPGGTAARRFPPLQHEEDADLAVDVLQGS